MSTLKFPDGFLWGAATSSHQVEGSTSNNWSEWEKLNALRLSREAHTKFGHLPHWERIRAQAEDPANYISGTACDHYHRFREDFDLARDLSMNAHRFSIEWSRIEPRPGEYDETVIAHYRDVLLALRERGLTPFVTLWHWTHPLWLETMGGVESRHFPEHFTRYAALMAERLGDLVTHWITLNEPESVVGAGFLSGNWPPMKRNPLAAWRVYHILARTHTQGYTVIKSIRTDAQVGSANILQSFVPYQKHSLMDRIGVRLSRYFTNEYFLRLTPGTHDFLTVQYYFHTRLKFVRRTHNINHPESDLGWEIYPEGLYHILLWLKRFGLPIYVTENGLADALDDRRAEFIREHITAIHRAIAEGVDIRGYFHWSLLDNFEWDKGFWPRFGLIAVDYATQTRSIRPSAQDYGDICKNNAIEIH